MKQLRIGLDFDGVIANTPRLKTEIAMQEFGIYVPMGDIGHDGCLKRGFTEKTYNRLKDITYTSYNIKPVYGCLTYLRKLIEDNHELIILSYRQKSNGDKIIENFLERCIFEKLPFICTDGMSKSKFVWNLDVFMDDRTEHLVDLRKIAKKRFLFDAMYNRNEKCSPGIERIDGWRQGYQEIRKLAR